MSTTTSIAKAIREEMRSAFREGYERQDRNSISSKNDFANSGIPDPTLARPLADGKLAALFSSASAEWETDDEFFAAQDARHHFTLDVCATAENAKVKGNFFTKEQDALKQVWRGSCWMNPVYGDPEEPCKPNCKKLRCLTCAEYTIQSGKVCKPNCEAHRGHHNDVYVPGIADWMQKARQTAIDGTGKVVCLVPSRTDTLWWHEIVLKPHGEQFQSWNLFGKDRRAVYWSEGLYVEVESLKGRLSFKNPRKKVSFCAPFPSALVVFEPRKKVAI